MGQWKSYFYTNVLFFYGVTYLSFYRFAKVFELIILNKDKLCLFH